MPASRVYYKIAEYILTIIWSLANILWKQLTGARYDQITVFCVNGSDRWMEAAVASMLGAANMQLFWINGNTVLEKKRSTFAASFLDVRTV